jgi:transcriptional regulator with XRE-family HTH domain
MEKVGTSQAGLARALGISQQAVGKIVNGETRNTSHLSRLARELQTTPEYLLGEIDDPDNGADIASRAAPQMQPITMQVLLPNEAALARMFEGLLRPLDRDMPVAELARTLARRLPTGLAQLQDLMPAPEPDEASVGDAAPPAPAKAGRASQRAPRT